MEKGGLMSEIVNDSKIAIVLDGIVQMVLETDSDMANLLLGNAELIGINDQPNRDEIAKLSVYDQATNSFTVYEPVNTDGQVFPNEA
jgi:hypothetical protein